MAHEPDSFNKAKHLRYYMRWGNKTNMCTTILKVTNNLLCGVLNATFSNCKVSIIGTDLVVLTIHALQVAMVEEHVTYSMLAADRRFFAAVNAYTCDMQARPCPAKTIGAGQPVCITLARAQAALFKRYMKFCGKFHLNNKP